MDVAAVLLELYGRVPPLAQRAVEGLELDALARASSGRSNPIGWLVWHLARVQDDHIADLLDAEQLWDRDDWAPRFGLPAGSSDTGFGHTPDQVASVRPESPAVLLAYLEAVHRRTESMLSDLTSDDLDRVIDASWDPPVTLGVRLVSVADDCLQHAGQAAFVRGLLEA